MPRGSKPKIDRKKVLQLQQQGLSHSDIAKHQNCNQTTVYKILKAIGSEKGAIRQFRDERVDILAARQAKLIAVSDKILNSYMQMDEETVSTMPWSAKTSIVHEAHIGLGILIEKEQLLSGLPGNIVAYVDLVAARKQTEARIEQLEALKTVSPDGAGDDSL